MVVTSRHLWILSTAIVIMIVLSIVNLPNTTNFSPADHHSDIPHNMTEAWIPDPPAQTIVPSPSPPLSRPREYHQGLVIDGVRIQPNSWERGLDRPFPHEKLYRSIRSFVSVNKTFPWHIVSKNVVFAGTGMGTYLQEWSYDGTRLACMPRFYIAGFPKCGTTDLWANIGHHPDVVRQHPKEMAFWTKRPHYKYRSLFTDYVKKYKKAALIIDRKKFRKGAKIQHPMITMDAEPSYIWRGFSPGGLHNYPSGTYIPIMQILASQPTAKIIVILRNPIDRTLSHYKHFGRQPMQHLYQLISKVVPRIQNCIAQRGVRVCTRQGTRYGDIRKMDLRVGIYYVYIKELLDMYPKDQVFIVKAEEYYSHKIEILKNIFKFLGLSPMSPLLEQRLRRANPKNQKKNKWTKNRMQPDHHIWERKARTLLKSFFAPLNVKLAQLLNDPWYLTWNE